MNEYTDGNSQKGIHWVFRNLFSNKQQSICNEQNYKYINLERPTFSMYFVRLFRVVNKAKIFLTYLVMNALYAFRRHGIDYKHYLHKYYVLRIDVREEKHVLHLIEFIDVELLLSFEYISISKCFILFKLLSFFVEMI